MRDLICETFSTNPKSALSRKDLKKTNGVRKGRILVWRVGCGAREKESWERERVVEGSG